MLQLATTAAGSDDLARVTSDTDDLEGLCIRLERSAASWDQRAAELSRRRTAHEADGEAMKVHFLDAVRTFAGRVVGGATSSGKRPPTSPDDSPVIAAAVGEAFRQAHEEARRLAAEARTLCAQGKALARAMDLCGCVVAITNLLEGAVPLAQRYSQLLDEAGELGAYAAPVLLNDSLSAWAPIFHSILGSRSGNFDVPGNVLNLGWLSRSGVEMPSNIGELDEGKHRISVALGHDGQPRIAEQVAAFHSAATAFLEQGAGK